MGHWGVKSYENDDASDAIDAGLELVHQETYEALMDDRNPIGFDQAQKRLANRETLAASLDALHETLGSDIAPDDYDEYARLAYAGIVVRHAEFGVAIPSDVASRAVQFLEDEAIDWEDATMRNLRKQKEINVIRAQIQAP